MALQNSTAQVKHYQWMLHDGSQWLNLNHDSVIETHYCQPGAQGIALFTSDYGRIFLDFDKMEIEGDQMTPYRQTSLSPDETEEYLWYFFENRRWHEYGSQGSSKKKASVTSPDIEQQYQINPEGSCTFTIGNMSYSLNFSAMTQSNLHTGMQRRVRRRPKYNSVIQKTSSLASLIQDLSLSSTVPPAGDEGVWREHKANASGVVCSVSNDDIEQTYQQNPQGQLQFTAGQFSYMLDYSGMFQVNNTLGTKRKVRRILCRNQPKSISLQGMALSSAAPPAGGYVWQFRGEEGVWTEYKTNNACGVVCSITSDDIEQSYQQNPQGQLQFTAGQFSYMLDYSGMFQVNNTLGTKRKVRRILCRNQPKSISLQGMALSSAAPPAGGYVWQFRGEEGVWTEYKTNNACGVVCSITSDDIEQSYQQNPQGQLQFTAGQFSYMLDYSGMFQVNNTLGTKRKVRRILCRNQQ
ncbi:PAR12 polymerase, partial [Polyodon spathula]|nr:PAR12 polymerase [Polyodon spathula]